ncbi:MAG TPA: TlpA disulfide reductase family protein [Saprospiraceae bacterium]|nr:hypothetical protein [Saprospirales bacterium]HRQ29820.1 TlpA disulfide reductase family protein [Saprospiraceae bacterium]
MALDELIRRKYNGVVAFVPTVVLLFYSIFFIQLMQLYLETFWILTLLVGYMGAAYQGSFWNRWRDFFIIIIVVQLAIIFNNEFNGGRYSLKQFLLFNSISVTTYLAGFFIGKIFLKKTTLFQHVKISLIILLAYIILVLIFQDNYIATAFWVILVFNITVYLVKKENSLLYIMLIFSPLFVIHFITWITGEHAFWELAIMSFIITYLLVLGSWLWMKNAGIGKWITANILVGLLVIFPAWFFMLNDIFNSSLVTRELDPSVLKHPVIYEDDTITLESLKGKILVLDAWNTSCGVCFKKFPDFDEVYNEFKSNDELVILAVNTPNRRDKEGAAKRIIESKGYDFENLYFTADSTAKALNIYEYPQLVYINRDQTKGLYSSLDTSPLLWNNPYRVIRRLLRDERFMDRFEVQK